VIKKIIVVCSLIWSISSVFALTQEQIDGAYIATSLGDLDRLKECLEFSTSNAWLDEPEINDLLFATFGLNGLDGVFEHLHIARFLLEAGMSVHVRDGGPCRGRGRGKTLSEVALSRKCYHAASLFREYERLRGG